MTNLAVIQTAGPDSAASREALDVVLNAAALDQPVQLVLDQAAVLNLVMTDNPTTAVVFGIKPLQKKYRMLELYEVAAPWVIAEALTQLQLTEADLAIPVMVKSRQEVRDALAEFQHQLCF